MEAQLRLQTPSTAAAAAPSAPPQGLNHAMLAQLLAGLSAGSITPAKPNNVPTASRVNVCAAMRE
eukprot:4640688-Prymnesium_polylepis.1